MRRFLVALAFAFSGFYLAGSALGQVQIASGSIQGTVVDEKGGAVVDAVVEARNLDTNLLKTVMTDSDGRFAFLSLPPGRYTITISKTGFGYAKCAILLRRNLYKISTRRWSEVYSVFMNFAAYRLSGSTL